MSNRVPAGGLIHNGWLTWFYPGGMAFWGAPYHWDYAKPLQEHLQTSIMQVYNRRSMVLTCHYAAGQERMWRFSYWYHQSPATAEQLRAIYPYHPLLAIGEARDSCPATLEAARATTSHYATPEEIRANMGR